MHFTRITGTQQSGLTFQIRNRDYRRANKQVLQTKDELKLQPFLTKEKTNLAK